MDCSMLSFPVVHHLPEFAQIHIHWFGKKAKNQKITLDPKDPKGAAILR